MRYCWVWVLAGAACGGKDQVAADAGDADTDVDADTDADTDVDTEPFFDLGLDPELPTATLVVFGLENGPGGGTTTSTFLGPVGTSTPTTTETSTLTVDTCLLQSAGTEPTTPTTPPTDPGPDPLDPGEVTVAIDGVALGGLGLFADWTAGAAVSFAITGNEFPAFDIPELVTLPPFAEPRSSVAGDGSVDVAWTPADVGEGAFVSIVVTGADDSLTCFVEDDGSFTIPAAEAGAVGAVQSTLVSRVTYFVSLRADCNVVGLTTTTGSP